MWEEHLKSQRLTTFYIKWCSSSRGWALLFLVSRHTEEPSSSSSNTHSRGTFLWLRNMNNYNTPRPASPSRVQPCLWRTWRRGTRPGRWSSWLLFWSVPARRPMAAQEGGGLWKRCLWKFNTFQKKNKKKKALIATPTSTGKKRRAASCRPGSTATRLRLTQNSTCDSWKGFPWPAVTHTHTETHTHRNTHTHTHTHTRVGKRSTPLCSLNKAFRSPLHPVLPLCWMGFNPPPPLAQRDAG